MKYIFSILLIALVSFKQPTKVLIVGDSLSCYKNGWQDVVPKRMDWEKTNLSVPGKTTTWMLNVLTNELKVNKHYDKVFIYGGCNDAFSNIPINVTIDNVQKMVDLCNANKIEPIVICGYNPQKVILKSPYKTEITVRARNRYSEIQSRYINELKNCKVIGVCQTITVTDSDDGIHLIGSGHTKFINYIFNTLNPK